jgi:hypothetical protein
MTVIQHTTATASAAIDKPAAVGALRQQDRRAHG